MKIRIKGNSIRYRLTKTEVEAFCSTGHIAEQTEFNSNSFTYELKAKTGISQLEANFTNNTITLYLPENQRHNWHTNTKVGFENRMTLAAGKELSLLVEKDFVCLDVRDEDESDNYPNPLAE